MKSTWMISSRGLRVLLFWALAFVHGASAFVPHGRPQLCTPCTLATSRLCSTSQQEEIHPAVQGWPEKHTGNKIDNGPRILHDKFTVQQATTEMMTELDVANWPTWTTSDKEKWAVGNQNADKIMPYGELSYMLQGKLEIVTMDGVVHVIGPGDFVTFPKEFQSSWRVLEELTWHYCLY